MIFTNLKIFMIFATLIYGTSAGGPGLDKCVTVITTFTPLISSFNSTMASFKNQALSDMQGAYTTNKTEDLQKFSVAAMSIIDAFQTNSQNEINDFLQIISQTFLGVSANDVKNYFVYYETVEGPLACLNQNIINNIYYDNIIAVASLYDKLYWSNFKVQ